MEVTSINEGNAATLCHNEREMHGLSICTQCMSYWAKWDGSMAG